MTDSNNKVKSITLSRVLNTKVGFVSLSININEVKYESLEKTLNELIIDVNQIHLLLGDEDITINDLEFDKDKALSELK